MSYKTTPDFFAGAREKKGMRNKNWLSSYTYGFNGKENDPETGTQDYGFRIYNPALGKFLSVDPLTAKYPELTPYQFASNSPIWMIDIDGLEGVTWTEYGWAIAHPDAALEISDNKDVAFAVSGDPSRGLPHPTDGGRDAFRHAYWNAINTRDVGAKLAEEFGTLHETVHDDGKDPVAKEMDLHNNKMGRWIAQTNPSADEKQLAVKVQEAYDKGLLKKVNIDSDGNYIGADGFRIDKTQEGWEKQKVLVSSNTAVIDAASTKEKPKPAPEPAPKDDQPKTGY